ncbi:hypothetical protein VSAK1_26610 [Vibrio mediterranei AK1]|uniref:hypothetical protein n=1 Tax=Vibrio mediterranei TaxID=689 RepID=UPI0001542D7E|nr:hypothetical protein [Vibrio mediterranei]EDL52200.1 hypothetical protein VSAK1_26610 [Vibrio mediterranei AK1]
MKQTLLSLLIASVIGLPSVALSSGFPTFDAANLLQKIMEYQTVLKEYDQILKQTGLSTNQLVTAIDEYQQMLREYQVLLNQVKSLENKLSARDYAALERELRRIYQDLDGIVETENSAYAQQRYGSLPSQKTWDGLSKNSVGDTPNAFSRQHTMASDAHIQGQQISNFRLRQEIISRNMAHLDSERQGLGDESELATLQMLVEQNQLLLDQLNLQNDMALATYSSSNQLEHRVSQGVLRSQQGRLERRKEAQEKGIVLDETPIR